MTNLLVSCVVTTRNEEQNIYHCLRSLVNQTYREIEVIVIDNGSVDDTKYIAREFTDYVFDYGPERSAQRNYGINTIAQGEWVIYLDADMILGSNVVLSCIERVKECPNAIGLYIPEYIIRRDKHSQVRNFDRTLQFATVIDAARFIRRDVFQKVGGFREDMTGPEDWDLDHKLRQVGTLTGTLPLNEIQKDVLNREMLHFNRFIFHNEPNMTVSKTAIKKSYYFPDVMRRKATNKSERRVQKLQTKPLYRVSYQYFMEGRYRVTFAYPFLFLKAIKYNFLVYLLILYRSLADK
jgi:glycosyltransferase involved in cell wall biosynthesis